MPEFKRKEKASMSLTDLAKFISELSPSDILQALGIIASFITSFVAIIISVITLRQNSKMIEESTRAVISVYAQGINTGTPMLFLVVKNLDLNTLKSHLHRLLSWICCKQIV